MNSSTIPTHHLVAELTASHEPFEQYAAAALRLADLPLTDRARAGDLHRIVAAYVHQLHIHHTAEELKLFPALRDAVPELGPAGSRWRPRTQRSIGARGIAAETLPRSGGSTT